MIHSSTSFGYRKTLGHSDFYPNNGDTQPGCVLLRSVSSLITFFLCGEEVEYQIEQDINEMNETSKETESVFPSCSHNRAIVYFTDSIIKQCDFTSYECSNWNNFRKGICTNCKRNRMGFFSEKTEMSTYYFLYVTAKRPHCVEFKSMNSQNEFKSELSLNETIENPYCANFALKNNFKLNIIFIFLILKFLLN